MLPRKYTLGYIFILSFLLTSCNKNMPSTDIQDEDDPDDMTETLPLETCENGFADIYPCNG